MARDKNAYDAEIGFAFGFGRGENYGERAWDTPTINFINSLREIAEDKVYKCGHNWSFLKPVLEISFFEGQSSARITHDVSGVEGEISVSDGSQSYGRLKFENATKIEEMYAGMPESEGAPQYAAFRSIAGTSADRGQRCDIYIYPLADQDYTLKFHAYINPDSMTDKKPFPWGGAEHSELFRLACMAAVEEKREGIIGTQAELFKRALDNSIKMDARKKEQLIDGDRYGRDFVRIPTATINGIEYD